MKLKKTNKWKDILYSWTGETLFKYPYSPQQSTDSMQSLSKLPMAYFKKLEQIILKCIWSPKKFPNGQNNPEKEEKYLGYGPILEPKADILISSLIPIYLKTILYSKLLESEVCEQASRSNAMENATNNANEILDNLKIEFNKARQAAITQEITEIAAAANAL